MGDIMPNLTLSVSEELHMKMKQHSEIRWSEVARQSIERKIQDIELLERLTQKSKLSKKDVKEISEKIDESVAKKLGLK